MCAFVSVSILCLCHLEHLQFSRDMWGLKKQCPDVVRSTLGELQVQPQESFLCSGQAGSTVKYFAKYQFLKIYPELRNAQITIRSMFRVSIQCENPALNQAATLDRNLKLKTIPIMGCFDWFRETLLLGKICSGRFCLGTNY